jgi:hypothetical protein
VWRALAKLPLQQPGCAVGWSTLSNTATGHINGASGAVVGNSASTITNAGTLTATSAEIRNRGHGQATPINEVTVTKSDTIAPNAGDLAFLDSVANAGIVAADAAVGTAKALIGGTAKLDIGATGTLASAAAAGLLDLYAPSIFLCTISRLDRATGSVCW